MVQIGRMPRNRKTSVAADSAAAAIKAWRRHLNLTQAQLEQKINKGAGTVSGLENGGTQYTQDHLEQLAKAFKCTPAQVLLGPPDPKNAESLIISAVARLDEGQRQVTLALVESLLQQRKRLKLVT